ncbi:hypothetical protein [Neptuniibacter sp. QD37_11]|uniref:hypothetical protein n=1 Tax=Neptuniibacter sp. QD37_11 TaxID=3398209 RepID=UPI0039F5AA62
MMQCEQTEGLSVLEHGFQVARYYNDLLKMLSDKEHTSHYEWKLPEWADDPFIIASLLPLKDVLTYQIYHDCGKPLCFELDEQGRRHFPNHAEVSYQLWCSLNPDDDVAWLIRHDMDIHLARAVDAESIAYTKFWATQLLTGLAELHANAAMFGGIESTSFKIKYKNLNKMGKRILSYRKTLLGETL